MRRTEASARKAPRRSLLDAPRWVADPPPDVSWLRKRSSSAPIGPASGDRVVAAAIADTAATASVNAISVWSWGWPTRATVRETGRTGRTGWTAPLVVYVVTVLGTFDADGGRTLSYTTRGTGPLVVCVPGGPGMDPEAYFAAMDLPGFELLIFAPRGTDASTKPTSLDGYRIDGFVDDLESLRLHLGAEALTLYGNSHGGCMALAYACRSPERINRLVVTNAPPRMDDSYRDAVADVQRRFAEEFPDGARRLADADAAYELMNTTEVGSAEWRAHYRTLMARYVAHEGPAESVYLDRLCAAQMNFESVPVMYAEFTNGLDLLTEASTVTAPALVIAGEFDVVVPPVAMQWIADALPSGRYFEFKGVGHFPEVEAGAQFSELVGTFLAQ